MPNRNGNIFCINHPDILMKRNSGFNAVIKVENSEVGFIFDASNGIPLVVFFCESCGYVESYAAQKTEFWNQSVSSNSKTNLKAAEFEYYIEGLLRTSSSPFREAKLSKQVKIGDSRRVIDFVAETDNEIYLIEVKYAFSHRTLGNTAAQIRFYTDIFKQSFVASQQKIIPIIIAPAKVIKGNEIYGVPVLKVDLENNLFINADEVRELSQSFNY